MPREVMWTHGHEGLTPSDLKYKAHPLMKKAHLLESTLGMSDGKYSKARLEVRSKQREIYKKIRDEINHSLGSLLLKTVE